MKRTQLNRTQLIAIGISTLTSLSISCTFVLYGGSIVYIGLHPGGPAFLYEDMYGYAFPVGGVIVGYIVCGALISAYGLCGLWMLAMALRGRAARAKQVMAYGAVMCLGVFAFASLDFGRISGVEFLLLLCSAVVLAINWFAVITVIQLKTAAPIPRE